MILWISHSKGNPKLPDKGKKYYIMIRFIFSSHCKEDIGLRLKMRSLGGHKKNANWVKLAFLVILAKQ